MSKINPAVAIGLVVAALAVLIFVIVRSMGSSASDMKGLVPPPRAGDPTFAPNTATRPMGGPPAGTPAPTSKLKNMGPQTDSQ